MPVGFFFPFWARFVKTCNKKGEAEMHWTARQHVGLLQDPFEYIPLFHIFSFFLILLFKNCFKLYLIVSNHKLGMTPLISVQCIQS